MGVCEFRCLEFPLKCPVQRQLKVTVSSGELPTARSRLTVGVCNLAWSLMCSSLPFELEAAAGSFLLAATLALGRRHPQRYSVTLLDCNCPNHFQTSENWDCSSVPYSRATAPLGIPTTLEPEKALFALPERSCNHLALLLWRPAPAQPPHTAFDHQLPLPQPSAG